MTSKTAALAQAKKAHSSIWRQSGTEFVFTTPYRHSSQRGVTEVKSQSHGQAVQSRTRHIVGDALYTMGYGADDIEMALHFQYEPAGTTEQRMSTALALFEKRGIKPAREV